MPTQVALTDVLGHAEELANNFLKVILPALFKRLYVTIKAIAVTADECIRTLLTRAYFWSFKCIPEVRLSPRTHATNPSARRSCGLPPPTRTAVCAPRRLSI